MNKINQTARFVVLEDCGHCIESTAMDKLMKTYFDFRSSKFDENNNVNFNLPQCPTCNMVIRRNQRYSKYFKNRLALIEKMKLKQYGCPKDHSGTLKNIKIIIIKILLQISHVI